MSRVTTLAAALAAAGLTATAVPAAQAAPLPALTAVQVGADAAAIDRVGWRRGYHGGYGRGYGYRRSNAAGALFAGAALGLIGGAIAASAAPRYDYYGGYGGYGYGYRPAYYGGYGYGGYPAYGYGYADPYGW